MARATELTGLGLERVAAAWWCTCPVHTRPLPGLMPIVAEIEYKTNLATTMHKNGHGDQFCVLYKLL